MPERSADVSEAARGADQGRLDAPVLPGPWDNGYRATDPKLGRGLVVRKGNYIAGIFGSVDDATAFKMVSSLVNALK